MIDPLLSRIEDAGLNASAPPQQRWCDGWLLRLSPGKAKRARCVNALAEGRLPLEHKLAIAEAAYAQAGLPMFVRITPFSLPARLDAWLEGLGFVPFDDTRVMVSRGLPSAAPPALPRGTSWHALVPADFAEQVGRLRGSPPAQREAHAQRLALSPVPYRGFLLRRDEDGAALAVGQIAIESGLVGLYDVFTDETVRDQGLARLVCSRLLALAGEAGAQAAYLQVEGDNLAARRVYHALGFADAYTYHYRAPPGAA